MPRQCGVRQEEEGHLGAQESPQRDVPSRPGRMALLSVIRVAVSHLPLEERQAPTHNPRPNQEQGPDDVTEEERDDMYMRAALNVFMSNRVSDSLPDSTLLGVSDAELRELLGGAD